MQISDVENSLSLIGFKRNSDNIYVNKETGYWSNLSKSANKEFIDAVQNIGPYKAVEDFLPQYKDMIFSARREAALDLFDHKPSGICIDYGCMWGVMSFGMAKRGYTVLALDQTYESLQFISKRTIAENSLNIITIKSDIREFALKDLADYAIVNGVLEWVPENSEVIVKDYYNGKDDDLKKSNEYIDSENPRKMQLAFLKNVRDNLKQGGQLLLTIENKLSYEYFMGKSDPHSNLLFTTFLPRIISNAISKLFRKREYRNYIYSFDELKQLVKDAGFSHLDDYCCFPNYHFPALVLPNSLDGINMYETYENKNRITIKQKIAYRVEIFLMKVLKAKNFCPAIVIVARK